MKKIVIGTAGHIDHGKTALVKALTGIDCDRLKEEKERGITTELGFAHYRFGDDLVVGIVDVPGHEKFIRHMVAGAWGIDMVLFIIAADEGVMPQTREHMDICDMLGVKRGIIVITKTDLVDDDMVDLVKEDVREFLAGRSMERAPVVAVSAMTGDGMDRLRDEIYSIAACIDDRSGEGIFRLPVDRVFSLRGLGTIVTGTCISGSLKVGDEVEIFPLAKRTKIKSMQAYHEDTEEIIAGQRVALNLQGIEKGEIKRGVIIGKPRTLLFAHRVDATLKYLKLPFKAIKSDTMFRFHIAATQEEARLVILEKDTMEPGEELFVQLVFRNPIVALPGDNFILRGSYAVQTIGGGTVLDIMPQKHKRKTDGLAGIYRTLVYGSDLEKTIYHIQKSGFAGLDEDALSILIGKGMVQTRKFLSDLARKNEVKTVGKTTIGSEIFGSYKTSLKTVVEAYFRKNPLKAGISMEELRMTLPRVEVPVFRAALMECAEGGTIEVEKDKVRSKRSGNMADKETAALEKGTLESLAGFGLMPPALKELSVHLKVSEKDLRDILARLAFEGKVVKLKGDMYFCREVVEEFKKKVVDYLRVNKEMTPADLKSLVDISRKYLIPLLEYLDEVKLTIRTGDKRILRS